MPSLALLLIDVQKGLDLPRWGIRNNPGAEQAIAALLAHWRRQGLPVIHVRHDSLEPDSPLRAGQAGNDFKAEAQPLPDEPVFTKHVNSAFIGTTLESFLRQQGIHHLAMAGLTTDHCVSTSVRMAANLGFATTVITDACATFNRQTPDGQAIPAETVHQVHLASLQGEFCQLRSSQALLKGQW